MLTFIPWVLLVLQKKESSDLDSGGTLPGLCRNNNTGNNDNNNTNDNFLLITTKFSDINV